MKARNYLLIIVAALGLLMITLGAHNVADETVVIEEPLEVEAWMTQPFTTN